MALFPTRFAPGTSPFRAKGNVYKSANEFYDEHLPGGLDVLCNAMDADHCAFMRQPFLAASWYDALPISVTSFHAARIFGVTHHEMLRARARWQAQRDIHGIYKFLIKVSSPDAVAVRFGKVMLQYFDFGESEARMIEPRVCEVFQRGVPEPFVDHIVPLAEGFVTAAMARAGAMDVRLQQLPVKKTGAKEGIATFDLAFRIAWR